MFDLHIHTTFSDGDHTPEEVVKIAAETGVKALAITDHDTIDGLSRGYAAAQNAGIEFLGGIEISVSGNQELHILGYGINPKNPELLAKCTEFKNLRIERISRITEYLCSYNIKITKQDIMFFAGNHEFVGRPHIATALVKHGYARDIREAFDKYLTTPDFERIERPKPSPKEGVELILNAGGIPVLAHPSLLQLTDNELEKMLISLKSFGLRGIECYYSLHASDEIEKYKKLTEHYKLIITGGSDFHGKTKPDIKIGTGRNNSLCFNDRAAFNALREELK
jgi:hypothetical protein